MGQIRIPPQYLSVGSLGFVAGWMSRGGEGLISYCGHEDSAFSCGLCNESREELQLVCRQSPKHISCFAAITLGRQVAIAGTVAVVGGVAVKLMHH